MLVIMESGAVDTTGKISSRISLLVFVFFFALYALTLRGVPTGGDAFGMFLVTASLVDDGDVFLDLYSADMVVLVPGMHGQMVSKYGIAQSLVSIPAYKISKYAAKKNKTGRDQFMHYFVTAWTNALIGALICVFFFLIGLRLGFGTKISLLLTILLGVCSLLWPHAKTLFSEPLQALCMLGGLLGIMAMKRSEGGGLAALVAGVFLGMLVAAKSVMVLALVPFLVYFAFSLRGSSARRVIVNTLMFLLPLGFWALVVLGYNYLRFGNFFETGYLLIKDRDSVNVFNSPLFVGLHGLFLSSGKGIFFYSPVLLFGVLGFPAFWKKHRAEALLILGVTVIMSVVFAKWYCWHGDYTWGPRFLVPCVPLMLLPAGEFFKSLIAGQKTLAYLFAAVVILFSFAVQVPGVVINNSEYLRIVRHQAPFDISFDAADPDRLDLRDNMMSPHFIPEFSPIAGHIWLLKHTIRHRDLPPKELIAKMQEDYPWKRLMPYAPPANPTEAVAFDFWWFYYMKFYPKSARWAVPLVWSLIIFVLASGVALAAAAKKTSSGQDINTN